MKVCDHSSMREGTGRQAVLEYRRGVEQPARRDLDVQVEHIMDIRIAGRSAAKVVCSPNQLVELGMGRLKTDGLICSIDDVETVSLYDRGSRMEVSLKGEFVRSGEVSSVIRSSRSGHHPDAGEFLPPALTRLNPKEWDPEWVYTLASMFSKDSPMHSRTHGTHSCYLARCDEIICCCEDLGRHNAVDKVVGRAMMERIDLSQCILYTSGRVPVDMVVKMIRAGVPIVISNAVSTSAAVELAVEYGLTLICRAKPDSFLVLNDPTSMAGEICD